MPPCFDNAESVTLVQISFFFIVRLNLKSFVNRFRQREKLVALLGRTDTGKSSTFNLMTGLCQPIGNRISSTTRQCFSHSNFIDTPGFGDTRSGELSHLSLIDFLLSLSSGIDYLFYFVRYGAMNSTDLDLFVDIYKRILSIDAYSNSCLVISDYSLPNLEQVNVDESEEKNFLLKQLHENDKYSYILEKFDNRVIFIDVSPYDAKRREISKEIIKKFLCSFQPKTRFNCQNLQDAYRLLRRTQEMETVCLNLKTQIDQLTIENQHLTHLYEKQIRHCQELDESYQRSIKQLEQIHEQTLLTIENNHILTIEGMKRQEFRIRDDIKQVRQQLEEIDREMDRSLTFNVVSYIPLIHIITNIIELNTKRRITQLIRKILHSKKKVL
jgi:energy-coupling factor transporter ATP-binding protein EcfA2